MTRPKAWLSWSSGKDATLALDAVRRDGSVEVVGLLTTLDGEAGRVAMHAVRRELLESQADRLGLPLHVVDIPSPCPNEVYEARMAEAMARATAAGVERMVFGDLFLEDVRAYREAALEGSGVLPMFPLWARPTDRLAGEMVDAGVRAVLTCVDPRQLSPEFVGRPFDARFLADLPAEVDPCGERGEFHTFVWDGPGFSAPIDVEVGEVVQRDGFVFCDVLPASAERGIYRT
jgi:uncharacterized protein (TIGR00290 family)